MVLFFRAWCAGAEPVHGFAKSLPGKMGNLGVRPLHLPYASSCPRPHIPILARRRMVLQIRFLKKTTLFAPIMHIYRG
eukprot:COSAG05_NODE_538_length_8854_cov_306.308738_19_plen_78_part_00